MSSCTSSATVPIQREGKQTVELVPPAKPRSNSPTCSRMRSMTGAARIAAHDLFQGFTHA
jgi:hypothetical protein